MSTDAAVNKTLNKSGKRANEASAQEKTWTEAATGAAGNIVHAAQDLVSNTVSVASDVLQKVESGKVMESVQHAAESAMTYARATEEKVVGVASAMVSSTGLLSTAESTEAKKDRSDSPVENAGEAPSPALIHQSKRAKVYSVTESTSQDSDEAADGPGLEANLDKNLVGPQPTLTKPVSKHLNSVKHANGHKRVDSNDRVWKAEIFE